MKSAYSYKALFAILLLCAVAYIAYRFSVRDSNRYLWAKTYTDGNHDPYDFGVLRSLLKNKSRGQIQNIENGLTVALKPYKPQDSVTYIFIGGHCYMHRKSIEALLDFAKAGHQVLMISEGFPDTLMAVLNKQAAAPYTGSFDAAVVRLSQEPDGDSFTFTFRSFAGMKGAVSDWVYFTAPDSPQLQISGFTGLGRINGKPNHLRYKVGRGSIDLHSSPILLSNYALRNEAGFKYLNRVFRSVYTGNVLYDTKSRRFRPDAEPGGQRSDSPLAYILKQPALRWAWYLFLTAVLLFFMFRARRTQRIIPVPEYKRNTGVGLTETLGSLYYQNADHRQMAETKMQLFLYFVRHRLGIQTNGTEAETIQLITRKTGISEIAVKRIFIAYERINKNPKDRLPAERLTDLHSRIAYFYTLYHNKH